MCRYAMYGPYKSHYTCFDCRKSFKKPKEGNITCPHCGKEMADMGLDFKAPKRNDIRGWKAVKKLYVEGGITYHSCGCGGPGFRPTVQWEVKEFLRSLNRKNGV